MERVIRAVLWHRILDSGSMETAWLSELETGYAIEGTIAGAHEKQPLEVSYRLECDADWRSRSVRINQKRPSEERSLILTQDDGSWSVNGDAREDLAACTDIDLGISPSTNALPINRMRLMVGEECDITAAWIRFPELDVIPAKQRYTRLGPLSYRYTGVETDFTAVVHVDRFGLPHLYEGIWARIAEWPH
jgi:hypothetical protein